MFECTNQALDGLVEHIVHPFPHSEFCARGNPQLWPTGGKAEKPCHWEGFLCYWMRKH